MKKGYLKQLVVGGFLLGSLAGLAACGSDSGSAVGVTPTGKVVKGPVSGASVRDKNGNVFATTDANGVFAITAQGPFTTTGGTYIPLNADGTAGTAVAAPPLSAPAGYSQITPLSTIVASAPASQQADVETQLAAALAKMGVSDLKTADFSVKTDANSAAIVFAEAVGAVLSTAANTSAASDVKSAINSAVTSALISAVQTLSTASAPTASQITSAITTQVSTAITSNSAIVSAVPALVSTISAATTAAATGANALPAGALPVQSGTGGTGGTTGSTGGTGGTSGIK
ncbi:hypothetical protein LPW11_19580 [Geomonas sp. RF6]|uniref:hypothetical protein n=1 Tax=Geomonas sp. RF6 TaxID=2897342 RepID=UPI001E2D9B93|nr:hypothetical protein [Geomonas sp. RF6]UFS70068.1 hypothetical protein LPW11_19580 [Geomonas sp. RF6]